MSLFVEWMNLIKERADESWLTDHQREVYDQLLARWQAHAFVNLYGPPGAGKTFIARLLAKHHGYRYARDLQEAPEGAPQVILDDAAYTRLLRPLARERQLGRVVLVTRQPVQETMPKARLVLESRDVRQACKAWAEHCGISLLKTIPEGEDLWAILRNELIARGEENVNQGA